MVYHTHNWELADDLRELRYLMANTESEKISLALDIGWVQRAGFDPLKVIDEFYPRIGYLHIKDTRDDHWTEVGRGMVDFRAIFADLNQRGFFGWLTVERDEELENAFESAKISRDALRDLGV
jgi:sugar phosphate isomerase/epimerase